jgi:hypothetical protein
MSTPVGRLAYNDDVAAEITDVRRHRALVVKRYVNINRRGPEGLSESSPALQSFPIRRTLLLNARAVRTAGWRPLFNHNGTTGICKGLH